MDGLSGNTASSCDGESAIFYSLPSWKPVFLSVMMMMMIRQNVHQIPSVWTEKSLSQRQFTSFFQPCLIMEIWSLCSCHKVAQVSSQDRNVELWSRDSSSGSYMERGVHGQLSFVCLWCSLGWNCRLMKTPFDAVTKPRRKWVRGPWVKFLSSLKVSFPCVFVVRCSQ